MNLDQTPERMEVAMAWETIILQVQETKKLDSHHRHYSLCPRCEGKLFAIPFHTTLPSDATYTKYYTGEREFNVLTCDRCGQFLAFEGCTGDCATSPKSKCEVCGKYYCGHCGITAEIGEHSEHIELHFCNDHIPDWYRNR